MNSRTKQILIGSISLLILAISACVFFIYEIEAKGSLLQSYISESDKRLAEEASFIRISRLVQETEENRKVIASSFFADEGDSISFLGEIESFADSIGLDLKTENLNKVSSADKKTEYITMTFVYSGEEKTVRDFNRLLEQIPYHSSIESLSLRRNTDGSYEGELTLHITLLPQ